MQKCAQSIAIRERAVIFLDQQLKIKNICCCDVYKIYTFTFISAFRGKDNNVIRHVILANCNANCVRPAHSQLHRNEACLSWKSHLDCEWHVKKVHV